MSSINITKINKIVKDTLDTINKSKTDLYDIAENARKECVKLENELQELKEEVNEVIKNVENLEKSFRKNKKLLAEYSKNFEAVSQSQLKQAYEIADKTRISLAVNREKEKYLIKRRNLLEKRIKDAYITVEKAENLVTQVGTAMDYLSGDLNNLSESLDDVEKRRYIGLRIIKAHEEERSRVAREIHDGPAQSMSNVVLKSEICERLIDKDVEEAKLEIRELKTIVRNSLKDVRKIIYDLRPMSLDDIGLKATLSKYIEDFNQSNIFRITLSIIGEYDEKQLSSQVKLTIFRIIQECLNNIKKHANASNASVKLEFFRNKIIAKVIDNGVGFDVESLRVDKDEMKSGFGLFGIQERIELVGGEVDIDSQIDKGTTVTFVVPIKY